MRAWIARAEPWLMAGLAMGVVADARATWPALLAALILAVIHGQPGNPIADNLRIPAAVLCACALTGLIASPQPELTLIQLARMGFGLLWMGSLSRISRPATWVPRLSLAAGMLCAALAVLAPFVVLVWPSKLFVPLAGGAVLERWVGDSANPNVLAGAMTLLLPIPLAEILAVGPAPSRRRRAAQAGLALIALIGLIALQSRGAWLATCAAVGVLLTFKVWHSSRAIASFFVACAGFMLAAPFVAWAVYGDSLQAMLHATTRTQHDIAIRLELWQHAAAIIHDFPLTGIGMGAFARVNALLYPPLISPPSLEHAHNLALQIAVDIGIPGLLAWFWLLGRVVRRGARAWHAQSAHANALAGALAGLAAMLVHGAIDAVTWGMVRPAVLVWGVCGLVLLASRDAGDTL